MCSDGKVYIEIFSGAARVASRWRALGLPVITIDVTDSVLEDVTIPEVRRLLRSWISAKMVAAVWSAPPCATFSSARRGLQGHRGGPVRSRDHVWGLPNCQPDAQQDVLVSNRVTRGAFDILKHAISQKVPCAIENPTTSLMWFCPPLRLLSSHAGGRRHVSDHCQFGSAWRKRTTVLSWFASEDYLQSRCRSKRGVCSRTGNLHVYLQGSDSTGRTRTSVAQPYPPSWAAEAANMLHSAVEQQNLQRLMNVVTQCTL